MSVTRPVVIRCDNGLCTAEFTMPGYMRGGSAEARRRARRDGWTWTGPLPVVEGGRRYSAMGRDYCPDHPIAG